MVEATAWFCPQTVANVANNPNLSLVILSAEGSGYQMVGEVQSVGEVAVLDGWDPALEGREPVPQVQRVFRIVVAEVLSFADEAHTDAPM